MMRSDSDAIDECRTGMTGRDSNGRVATSCSDAKTTDISKRLCDILFAATLFVGFAPIIIFISLAILLTDGRPIFFRQKRIGWHGKSFRILKFRTMSVRNADPTGAKMIRVGRLLRAYSLDELPQLLNVLQGTMSLVGPRPHIRSEEIVYERNVPDYPLRRAVKPGITGLAQVNGFNGPVLTLQDIVGRLNCDLEYVRNRSRLLDFKILLRTVPLLFFGRRGLKVETSGLTAVSHRIRDESVKHNDSDGGILQTPGI